MLRIKLQRVGKKHDPSFRVVVTDKRTGPKSNKHVDRVGHYDAIRKTLVLNKEKILEWISKGAQPTDTVHNLLVKEKIIEGKKKNVLPKKNPIVPEKEEEKEEAVETQKEENQESGESNAGEESSAETAEETKTEE